MSQTTSTAAVAVLFGLLSVSALAEKILPNTLGVYDKADGWTLLFNGKDTSQWRNYRKDTIGDGWKVQNGELIRKDKGAGDIITKKQFDSFELTLDYRISKGGNSGLMFHVTEEEKKPWQTGPEIQIQDNVDGHDPQKAGWLYQFLQIRNGCHQTGWGVEHTSNSDHAEKNACIG